MHCPSVFREERLDVLHRLISDYPLATLMTAGRGGLIANLIPFSLHEGGEFGILRAHLAKANKQLDDLRDGAETLVVFHGPQSYVTPSWYPSKAEHGKVVPTWNYAVVQVRGTALVTDDSLWLRRQIEVLTANQENQRANPWRVSDVPEDFVGVQLKGIVGIEIPVRGIEGKWKMSQNRLPEDRQGVLAGMQTDGVCPTVLAAMNEGEQRRTVVV
jgi:transcriptional regulator